MLSIPPSVHIFLARGATDLRKSFDGLAGAARTLLERDPLSGHLFVFCNGGRNRLKILFRDGSGFCIYHKKLARGTFSWPAHEADTTVRAELQSGDLLLILSGMDLQSVRERRWHRRRYPEVFI
ncbi:IS66 family insertion sequence element accessory protein TnpB [Candidatus Azambacteria bacterium]|nr:IS66 family insertion sequence element accessory protein TnpB [Candidatus Azambacteria bacterium]